MIKETTVGEMIVTNVLLSIKKELELAIGLTKTGEFRNRLTELNIMLLSIVYDNDAQQ